MTTHFSCFSSDACIFVCRCFNNVHSELHGCNARFDIHHCKGAHLNEFMSTKWARSENTPMPTTGFLFGLFPSRPKIARAVGETALWPILFTLSKFDIASFKTPKSIHATSAFRQERLFP